MTPLRQPILVPVDHSENSALALFMSFERERIGDRVVF